MKADARRIVRGEGRFGYPVDDATVEMDELVRKCLGLKREIC